VKTYGLLGALALTLLLFTASCSGKSGSNTPAAPSPSPNPPTPAPVVPLTLSGTVTNQHSGASIAGAAVSITEGPNAGKSATSDGSGNYSFGGLAAGDATLSASAPGFVTFGPKLTLQADSRVTLQLRPTTRRIVGHITDQQSGGVLPNINVSSESPFVTTRTDGNGDYVLDGVTSNVVGIRAEAIGYQTRSSSLTSGPDTRVDFVLYRNGTPVPPPPTTEQAPPPLPPGGVLIGFNGLGALPYSESGFRVAIASGGWGRLGYGAPGPSVAFSGFGTTPTIAELRVTADGGGQFRFYSADFYSSITAIPYVFTGQRAGAAVFTLAGNQGNTIGRFATVSNQESGTSIDTLLIRLSNTPGLPTSSNPMGVDNIILLR
jgi:Carboxypeptidase regulatory-like domain